MALVRSIPRPAYIRETIHVAERPTNEGAVQVRRRHRCLQERKAETESNDEIMRS